MSETRRIEILEQHVRALHEEVARLREDVRELRGSGKREAGSEQRDEGWGMRDEGAAHRPEPDSPARVAAEALQAQPVPVTHYPVPARPAPDAPHARQASPPPPPPPARGGLDFESLVGRYGTIALASLAILLGVGTFLSWAIAHGLLGPTQRVVLGFVGAGIVAAIGVRLSRRGEARFGNLLLALALAIVHVDAWAAGPKLHVMPTVVALAVAAGASVALAALALASAEQLLFVIGFAGALLAPFVTSERAGSVWLLLTYGWVVIATGIIALRASGWRPALWATAIGAVLYALTAVAMVVPSGAWPRAFAPALFALACAAAAAAWAREELRAELPLTFLGIGAIALLDLVLGAILGHLAPVPTIVVAAAGTLGAYAIAGWCDARRPWIVLGVVLLPLAFLLIVLANEPLPATRGALVAAGWALLAATLASLDDDERTLHLFVAALASGAAILLALEASPVRCIVALTLHALLVAVVLRRERARLLLAPASLSLAIATAWSFGLLAARAPYTYAPFLTAPSLAAAVVVAGLVALATVLHGVVFVSTGDGAAPPWRVAAIIAAIVAFFWVRQELVGAISPDVATFLLVIWYAVAGLLAIWVGRWRAIPSVRAVGLALACYAGFKVLVQTWDVSSISLRIGSRILVGAFLAAVAYWYRAREARPSPSPQPQGD